MKRQQTDRRREPTVKEKWTQPKLSFEKRQQDKGMYLLITVASQAYVANYLNILYEKFNYPFDYCCIDKYRSCLTGATSTSDFYVRLANNAKQCGLRIRRDVPSDGDCYIIFSVVLTSNACILIHR